MSDDERNFEDALRAMARELGQSLERAVEQLNLEDMADKIGVDPDRTREWIQNAGEWLRAQTEADWLRWHGEAMDEPPPAEPRHSRPASPTEGTFAGAEPHPLDLPTEEQGVALAALDSGRWTLEPGTLALAAHAHGPGPSDALGLVRELRARDWIGADGAITLAGRHALERWLKSEASPRR
jgi:hypothetical protein